MMEQTQSEAQVGLVSEEISEHCDTEERDVCVCLLGASFETGNLGVSALAESSVMAIRKRWPGAQVVLLASSREEGSHRLNLEGRIVELRKVPIRFSKNIRVPNHYSLLFLQVLTVRLLPLASVKRYLAGRNATLRLLLETRLFVDISGGDSFSDIYGMRRFILAFLVQLLPLMLKKDLVLFPQTYGPFKRRLSRSMARYMLKRAKRVYSRDQAGLDFLQGLLSRSDYEKKTGFAPDVAFLLQPRAPRVLDIGGLEDVSDGKTVIVGLNVSGLIYYGGYGGGNEFGLNVEYKALLDRIIDPLLRRDEILLLLVPHVIPTGGYKGDTENDLAACLDVQRRYAERYPERLFVAQGDYDQGEVKHIIGKCDFFIGTRMHSCIAALSQCIPAVGLAYSKKFKGVFTTVGVEDLVADMRSSDVDGIVQIVEKAFTSRALLAERLQEAVPVARQKVSNLLEGLDL